MASRQPDFERHRLCEVREGVYNVNICVGEGCYGVICEAMDRKTVQEPRRWKFWRKRNAK